MAKFTSYYFRGTVIVITLIVVMLYYVAVPIKRPKKTKATLVRPVGCYRINDDSILDISDTHPRKGKSIFFHETSCNSYINDKIIISSRQACAVESAARANPNFDVYLLYTAPAVIRYENTPSDKFLRILLTYRNVKILRVNYERYTNGTPLEKLYKSGKLETSTYSVSHASDVLRYMSLWKYGGIYLDLDTIVLESLEDLPLNYAGVNTKYDIASGILSFSATGQGHHFAQLCLDDLRRHFRGDVWDYNGPGVITRLLKDLCKANTATEMISKNCSGFTVYPPEIFYPVPYWKWFMYFDAKYNDELLNLTENSYVLHFWNQLSANSTVDVKSHVPYSVFARRYCPKVFAELEAPLSGHRWSSEFCLYNGEVLVLCGLYLQFIPVFLKMFVEENCPFVRRSLDGTFIHVVDICRIYVQK